MCDLQSPPWPCITKTNLKMIYKEGWVQENISTPLVSKILLSLEAVDVFVH